MEHFVIPGANDDLGICSFRVMVDIPETSTKISNYSINGITGETFFYANYGLSYYNVPSVGATVVNCATVVVPSITNKTNTSFHIQLLDIANDGKTGLVDLTIFGG
jgi:hypothetical protein